MSNLIFKNTLQLPQFTSPFIVLIDSKVYKKYTTLLALLKNNPWCLKIVPLQSGEQCKTLKNLTVLFNLMDKVACPKNTLLLAMGGGTILDLGGLVASLWMRGISWYSIPTTLLAQVDSCYGGKTGINFNNRKNLLGSIYLPKKIFIFQQFIKDLPLTLHYDGASEIFKHALLTNDTTLIHQIKNVFQKQTTLSATLIKKSILIKKNIIGLDFHEKDNRRIQLNFAHTLGHALEEIYPRVFNHGRAIWWGLKMELLLHDNIAEYLDEVKIIDSALASNPSYSQEYTLIVKNLKKILVQAIKDKKNLKAKEITLIQISKNKKINVAHISLVKALTKLQKFYFNT